MRVLALTHLYPSPWSPGRGLFNRYQFEALSAHATLRGLVPVEWTTRLVRSPGKISSPAFPVSYPCYYYTPKLLRGRHGSFLLRSCRREFLEEVREHAPQVVLSAWGYPDGWASVNLGKQVGIPVVVKVHGSDILQIRPGSVTERRTMEVLQHAAAIIAVSQDLKRKMGAMGVSESKIHVLYDGVDENVFSPGDPMSARKAIGLPFEPPVVLFIGRLVPVKGIDILIRACHRLKSRGHAFLCCIVGVGGIERALRRLTARLELGDTIRFCGERSHQELASWYRAATVFALPSHSEGVPSVLREAACCGLPYVATSVGGVPEIADLGESCLVPRADPEALADALEPFLLRDNTAPRRAAIARTHDTAAIELLEILQHAVEVTE